MRTQVKRSLNLPMRTASAASCFCLLAGCMQGADYAKPEVAVPSEYRLADQTSGPALLVQEGAWWSGFGDRYLDALVTESLASNRDLRIATYRVDEFAAVL